MLHQDTTFMFIIAGLIIAKMIQNRHPYFNANSFCTFWGFSVVTLATIVGLVSYQIVFRVLNVPCFGAVC